MSFVNNNIYIYSIVIKPSPDIDLVSQVIRSPIELKDQIKKFKINIPKNKFENHNINNIYFFKKAYAKIKLAIVMAIVIQNQDFTI